MNPIIYYLLSVTLFCLLLFLCTSKFWMWVYRHMDRYKRFFDDIEEFRALGKTYGCELPGESCIIYRQFDRKRLEKALRYFAPDGSISPDMYLNINVYLDGVGNGFDKEELKRACHLLAARNLYDRGLNKITVSQYAKNRTITRADLEAVLAST